MVPEERNLLFERPFGVHQMIHPIDVAHRGLPAGQQCRRLITHQRILIDLRLRLGMQQLLDRGLVALGYARFEFVAACPEAGTSHQVSHQSDVVLVCHL